MKLLKRKVPSSNNISKMIFTLMIQGVPFKDGIEHNDNRSNQTEAA